MQDKYKPITIINIFLYSFPVGRLALRNNRVYFEYNEEFIQKGLNISPLKLPFKTGLQSFDIRLFDGLAGVFNDSLPDGWGRLLLDRSLRNKGTNPDSISVLDRLAHVGTNGMGALIYIPDYSETDSNEAINLDLLASQITDVFEGSEQDFFEELLMLNGSSAGARPKAMVGVNNDKTKLIHGVKNLLQGFEHWLVKFTNVTEGKDAGAIEYVYSQMAQQIGIEMEETHLFAAKKHSGYFATKRFDRKKNNKIHMHTASGLLHSDFRIPALDYEDLIKLTFILTKDAREVLKLYRLAVFNVLAHNRDDHGKNFSYLMDESGNWRLAPAYDLTFSSGPRGEQSTMVMGEGKNPTTSNLISLANIADIKEHKARTIIEQTKEALSHWPKLAINAGVSKTKVKEIQKALNLQQ